MTTPPDPDVSAQVAAVRCGVGIWERDSNTLIRFTGRDAASWLQTQTSNDVLALEPGQGHANALLDRKAHLVAHFTLHRWDGEYWCLIEKNQVETFLATLDAHLFLEDVQMHDASGELEQIVVQGPRAPYFLATLLEGYVSDVLELLPSAMYECRPVELLGHRVLVFRISLTGEDGYILLTPAGEAESLLIALFERGTRFGVTRVGDDAVEVLRIEAGIPRFGMDMDSTNRIPETTLERDAVSYSKGCYVGQEVVAKLRTYGSVKSALMGLEFEDGAAAKGLAGPVCVNGAAIGEFRSGVYSPTLKRWLYLAYLDRDSRAPGAILDIGQPALRARVVVLPFVRTLERVDRANRLYHLALEAFERDEHDQDDTAIELLREAILLHPAFEDAYECLGVILNRHHRVDEAIHYMKILARLNPDSVMAHTNLSVFYLAKGMIDEAEIEKAEAAVLQVKHAQKARKAEEIAAEERERIRREAVERIAMFREVLEIDPDDPLATFGLGTAYIQLKEYDKAVPHLEHATRVQKDYSAAYLNLGKCHEFLGQEELAAAVYRRGIEAANRKGDLMPMREMERRLKSIEAGGVTADAEKSE